MSSMVLAPSGFSSTVWVGSFPLEEGPCKLHVSLMVLAARLWWVVHGGLVLALAAPGSSPGQLTNGTQLLPSFLLSSSSTPRASPTSLAGRTGLSGIQDSVHVHTM